MTSQPQPKLFPTHFQIILDTSEQTSLDTLYELHPDLDEVQLLHHAIRKGIMALNKEAEDRDPHNPTRSQLATSAARMPQNWTLVRGEPSAAVPAQAITPHRCIEPYIATSVSERLRQRLEDALSARPAWDEEGLWQRLLDL